MVNYVNQQATNPNTIQATTSQIIAQIREQLIAQARGMWRYRWQSVGVMWVVCIIGWLAVYSLPPVYSANARILVDAENAIRPLLQGIATSSNVIAEVNIVAREIKNRDALASVARETGLDKRASTDAEFAQLLESLRKRVHVKGTRDYVYSISFSDTDRDIALAVVESIVNSFVEKSLGGDRQESGEALAFLRGQIAEYDARLTQAEDRLAEFKRVNVAVMPDQRGDYFARLQASELSRDQTRTRLRLAQERRAELLRQLEGEEPVFGIMPGTQQGTGGSGFLSAKLTELEAQLAELRLQYTDKHPKIGQILETIERLEEQQERERALAPGARPDQSAANSLDLNPVYQNMRIQLTNVEVEIAALRTELSQQEGEVNTLRELVDTVPQVEAELGRLNRDYQVVKNKHAQLVAQLEKANLGENVEQSIDEVRFRMIDPPFADRKPTGPKRHLLLAAVLFCAVGLGGAVAFIANQLRPVFFSGRELASATHIPILGTVSLLLSARDMQVKRKQHMMFAMAFGSLVISFSVVFLFAEAISPYVRDLTGMVL